MSRQLQDKLSKRLRKVIVDTISPLLSNTGENSNATKRQSEATVDPDLALQERQEAKRTKHPTKPAGDFEVSFELPEDLEKLLQRETSSTSTNGVSYRFKLSERLDGWRVQCKERNSGLCDKYYYHKKSKTYLRSIRQVVKFVRYGKNGQEEAVDGGTFPEADEAHVEPIQQQGPNIVAPVPAEDVGDDLYSDLSPIMATLPDVRDMQQSRAESFYFHPFPINATITDLEDAWNEGSGT